MSDFDHKSIGLEKRDMLVYEALYKLNNCSLRAIAEETGLNRGTVYEIIKKLTSMGLATFTIVGQRRRYSAAPPDTFVALIREQQDTLRRAEQTAELYAAQFKHAPHIAGLEKFAAFYEGDEGVAAILRDVLSTNTSLYHVISSRAVSEFLYNNFPNFSRQRIKQKMFVHVIAVGRSKEETIAHAERRQLVTDQPSTAPRGYTIIYGPKTAFITLNDQNVPFGIVINNQGIADTQRLLFNQLWQTL